MNPALFVHQLAPFLSSSFSSSSSFSDSPTNEISNRIFHRRIDLDWPSHLQRPPVQPLSDSMAFHYSHLAKTVRELAGGRSAVHSVFFADAAWRETAHRNLQLVGFQVLFSYIGDYV